MAEYAEGTFDVQAYLAQRPRYPAHLYDLILEYHKCGERVPATKENARPANLLDLGCGPGQSSWPLLPHFDSVLGVDPSEGMIANARQAYTVHAEESRKNELALASARYEVCSVERLDQLDLRKSSFGCAVAGTAAHWFDMQSTYEQLLPVLCKDATVALWTYDLAYPAAHQSTAELVMRFAYEDLAEYVDRQSCRRIQSLYAELEWPNERDWYDVTYYAYPNEGGANGYTPILPRPHSATEQDTQIKNLSTATTNQRQIRWDWQLCTRQVTTWSDLMAAKRTNSSYFNWRKDHPDVELHNDIAAQQVDALRRQVAKDRQKGIGCSDSEEENVEVMRPMGLLLMRKR